MGEPQELCELTSEEQHLIALLRQEPQTVNGLAEALPHIPHPFSQL
jgi:hypothetical protein